MKKLCILFTLCSIFLFADANIGKIAVFKGNAVIFTESNPAEKTVELNSKIFLKDIVRTETNTALQIFFEDATTCSVGENTEIAIEEYRYVNDKKSEQNDSEFKANLKTGKMRINSGKIAEVKPQRFNMTTKRATIGIRGCIVDAESTDQMDEITVQEIGPNGSIIIVTKNNETYVFLKPGKLIIHENGNSTRQDLDPRVRNAMMRDFLRTPIDSFDKQKNVQNIIQDKNPENNLGEDIPLGRSKFNNFRTNPIKNKGSKK